MFFLSVNVFNVHICILTLLYILYYGGNKETINFKLFYDQITIFQVSEQYLYWSRSFKKMSDSEI